MRGIKLQSLRYFVALAEELHFGRAADRCAVTQPPLSKAIKNLEEMLNVRLFERDSKQVQTTPAGDAFYADAVRMLESLDRAADRARRIDSGLQGTLEIGVTGTLLYRGAPAVVALSSSRIPGVEVMLREVATSDQIHALMQGRLDAGFLNSSIMPSGLASMPLPDEPFLCCLPEHHPMASIPRISLELLADERFVMFARDVAPQYHDNILSILTRAGITPRLTHAARQWLTVIAMVANDMGVALVPASLERTGMRGVRFLPLSEADAGAYAHAHLAWNPERVSAALRNFLNCAAELFPSETP
nr:LysR family transcriptional regulator [Sphingomonas formosensis]